MKELLELKQAVSGRTGTDNVCNQFPTSGLLKHQPDDEFPKDLMSTIKEKILSAITYGFVIDAVVTRKDRTGVGTVLGYNITTGLYTGERYPIVVKFENGTFEYDVDDLTLKEVPEDRKVQPHYIHIMPFGQSGVDASISNDISRAVSDPFKRHTQWDHSGPIPKQLSDCHRGYVWAGSLEAAVVIAKNRVKN